MKTYNVTIISPLGWMEQKTTTSRKELYNLRREAMEIANQVDFNVCPEAKHLVYYYEIGERVKVLNQPMFLDDESFYKFVDEWKPTFVGARHKK